MNKKIKIFIVSLAIIGLFFFFIYFFINEDKETSLNLANFAHDVLSYLIEYGDFDDLQKQQFEADRNSVKMLIMKIKAEKSNEQEFEAQKI